ncbi:AraC family ligand binding domain-containing protein [Flavobacterium sp. ENC]|uniref:AraC family ligand binding domain-containing protein n=1 Tax=Flavobacterium sp. ENC TaxID=2897330 RepID=UPI001E3F459E|nr:AraC family ligand binding domain-containing protein [Flavobacterium sp. ENC]MCD0467025.1 AraC family ligand binding domain-containing protein [Flavobacterium sp. ENC]
MKKENIHSPYEIFFIAASAFSKIEQRHNFFELVFIRSGTGKHYLNESECDYHAGQLFLITPEDTHHFTVEKETEFFFLRFNNIHIEHNNFSRHNLQRLEYILKNASHINDCILRNVFDKGFIPWVIEAIYKEQTQKDLYKEDLVHELVNTIIIIAARSMAKF